MSIHEKFSRYFYWPLAQALKREHTAQVLQELKASQWKSKDELLSDQLKLLRKTVSKAAREIPFYTHAFSESGWDPKKSDFSYDDFAKLPTLGKDDVRDRLREFLNPHYKGRITTGTTSGSTGKSLTLYYSSEHESYSEAARWRGKEWWGIKPGDAHLAIWGRFHSGAKVLVPQLLKSYLMNYQLYSAFDIRSSALKKIYAKLEKFRPEIIYGYPSGISALARYIKFEGLSTKNLKPKVVMITAESCTPQQRRLIEEVFNCKTANEYGCSETGGFVYECPTGNWHISTEVVYTEFLNEDLKPARAGQRGNIHLTHLRNNYMPLIRYKVDDVGSSMDEECACGRSLPLMQVSVAKESDLIRLPNGEAYMSGDFLYLNKVLMGKYPQAILEYRVTQKTLKTFTIQVIQGAPEIDKAEKLFKKLMRKQLGEEIRVEFERVDEIERDKSGKLRYFVSEVRKARCEV